MNIFGRESLKAPFKLPANIVSKAGLRHAGGKKRMLPAMLCLAAAGMALLAGRRMESWIRITRLRLRHGIIITARSRPLLMRW